MIAKLAEHEGYPYLLEALKDARPQVPNIDCTVDNDRYVIYNTLKQQGFDLAVSIINPERTK